MIPDLPAAHSTEEITEKDNHEEIPVSTVDSTTEEKMEEEKPAMQGDSQP